MDPRVLCAFPQLLTGGLSLGTVATASGREGSRCVGRTTQPEGFPFFAAPRLIRVADSGLVYFPSSRSSASGCCTGWIFRRGSVGFGTKGIVGVAPILDWWALPMRGRRGVGERRMASRRWYRPARRLSLMLGSFAHLNWSSCLNWRDCSLYSRSRQTLAIVARWVPGSHWRSGV